MQNGQIVPLFYEVWVATKCAAFPIKRALRHCPTGGQVQGLSLSGLYLFWSSQLIIC